MKLIKLHHFLYILMLFVQLLSGVEEPHTERNRASAIYQNKGGKYDPLDGATAQPPHLSTEDTVVHEAVKIPHHIKPVTKSGKVVNAIVAGGLDEFTEAKDLDSTSSSVDVSAHTDQTWTDPLQPEFSEYYWSMQIQEWGGILCVVLGVIGNILCIAILVQNPPLTSTYMYLVNLAAADLVVCVVGQLCRILPRSLTGFDTAKYHPAICKMWFFFNHSAATISGWTLVAVTLERTLVVYLPLRAKSLCTREVARRVILIINVLFSLIYIHYFWSYGIKYKEIQVGNQTELVATALCSVSTRNPAFLFYMINIRTWQDMVVRSVGPFTCLLVCNILIVKKLFQELRKRKSLTNAGADSTNGMASLTSMLLTVSFTYLVCVAPLQIMYLVDKSDPFGWKIQYRWQAVAALRWAFAVNLKYLNHAINFLLYCISGEQFRRGLKRLLLRCCPRCQGKESMGSSDSNGTLNSYQTKDSEADGSIKQDDCRL